MNLKHHYWYFNKIIPKKFCDDIIRHGKSKQEEIAITGGQGSGRDVKSHPLSEKELKDLKHKRDSKIVWLNDQWIYNEIFRYVNIANQNSEWNFHWDWAENCQFTKYTSGQHYGWHQDAWNEPYKEDKGQAVGKVRKLSVTVNLTDGTEYEGGDLEFYAGNPEIEDQIITVEEARSKGSVIVFPSFLWHRVKPVTKGTRYSLVVWCCGTPFK